MVAIPRPESPLHVCDVADPGDLLPLHGSFPAHWPFLLESAASGTAQGRYDLLLGAPGEVLVLDGSGNLGGPEAGADGDFLAALDRWWHATRAPGPGPGLPFAGGWFLFLGYELAGQVEPGLRLNRPTGLPVAFAVRVRAAVIRDRAAGTCRIVAERPELLAEAAVQLAAAGPLTVAPLAAGPVTEEDPQRFLAAVERARRYIVAGDIFQANLSREWRAPLPAGADPAVLYARLRRTNPGPFSGLARWGEFAVASSSPERLLRLCDGVVETRPIAGTRPRGADRASDAVLAGELIAHPKERAEHVMLVDLERNDLGRICQPGSVEVNESMVVESYAHVHHIVSNVRGRLQPGIGPGEAIRAVFPGGTITGCPKVRCMEIIQELEAGARGPYTGSMGWLGGSGDLDLNILIRSIEIAPGEARFRAGAGIVFDSVPEAELAETRAKARGLLLALAADS